MCIGSSCSSQKDTAISRSMQNLTARYNYIYNSKVLLNNHQLELTENYADNYDQILPVYLGPEVSNMEVNQGLNLKPMDDIIKKAQLIILEKSFSNYTDDAYILLGKASFFNGNYFNAAEYFDYITKTYKNNQNTYLEALNWKARSLMQLRRITEANQVLDTLDSILPKVKVKRQLPGPLSTIAQMCIYLNNDTAAISYLKDALRAGGKDQNKIRWTYILAQLYERQQNYKDAAVNYRKVQRSNAPFEMYFNATLNQIKLKTLQNNNKIDKHDQVLALLKDDKNLDYNDQIYFQIAEGHAADQEFQEALKYYLLSVQKSNKNQHQKGLSYLRIADLNFKHFKDDILAKSYYDSTVNTLPKNYPGYDLILKKSINLKYLTDRYELITLQDTLQSIARLPEELRKTKIQMLANPVIITQVQSSNNLLNPNSQPGYSANKLPPQNSFYFSNTTTISIGFSDFKRKWGNRKLENNWRQSVRTSAQETTQQITNVTNAGPINPDSTSLTSNKESLIAEYTAAIPLNSALMAASNQKIIDAYYEIASFYLQELDDTAEAANVYKTLLIRFPQNNHLASIYYSLYLISKPNDPAESLNFKNRILKDFPSSIYAKTILDPTFSVKQSEAENEANNQYNDIFSQYEKKDFISVIRQANKALSSGNPNILSPQLAYLKAIAIGRTNNADSLLTALNNIIENFPDDKLTTPLVKEHITYVMAHLSEFQKRKIALVDFDPNEPPFSDPAKQAVVISAVVKPKQPIVVLEKITTQLPNNTSPKPAETPKAQEPDKVIPAIITDGTFNNAVSATYYFVVHVSDAALTLSSSRFGIGQFNRGNYIGSNLKHQLKEFDNDQLIYVGNFSNFEDVKSYAAGITPQLKQIMKVPVNIYSSFIISKENFDKLISGELLTKYIEFYQKNY
ncbi:type IX secretion system periplasmic lipoprotein PorW/SprE [Pedobacter psychroterrae]